MSVFTGLLSKKLAVLSIQVFGILTVLCASLIARNIFAKLQEKNSNILVTIFFALVIFYYPLSYWSLMGMETGLVTVFFLLGVLKTICWLDLHKESQLWNAAVYFGIAFLARNDALVFGGITTLYLSVYTIHKKEFKNLKPIFMMGIILGIFVFSQTAFRWFYYGEILPNTYYLKVDQIPFLIRINDGIVYSFSFIQENLIILIFTVLGAIFFQNLKKWYFFLMILLAGAYQIYIGGDAWGRWRFMIPVIPLVILLSFEFIKEFVGLIAKSAKEKSWLMKQDYSKVIIFVSFSLFLWYSTASPYLKEIKFETKIKDVLFNQHNVNKAVALNEVLIKDASIGVFWAGSIPYYTNFYAVDFLGKSDKHIAQLYPHLPMGFVWLQQITLPGHNKYDLNYSIKVLQPVYIQRYYWVSQNLRRYTVENYVRFEYQGTNGSTTLMLKKDSPYVDWNKGEIVKWDE